MDLRAELLGRYIEAVEPEHANRDTDFASSITLVLSDGPAWADLAWANLPSSDGDYWYRYRDSEPYVIHIEDGKVWEFGYDDDEAEPVAVYVVDGVFAGPLVAPRGRMVKVTVEADAIVSSEPSSAVMSLLNFSVEDLSTDHAATAITEAG